MLKPHCRHFRARFEPGKPDAHRRTCPTCDAYAAALEGTARAAAALALPPALESRLRALGRPSTQGAAPVRVQLPQLPQLPMPPGLAGRLRAIARRPAPPVWVRSPWQGLAASFTLALFLQGVLGNPVARAQPLAVAVGDTVTAAWQGTASRKEDLAQAWVAPTVASVRQRLRSAREQAAAWAEAIDTRTRRLFGGDPEI